MKIKEIMYKLLSCKKESELCEIINLMVKERRASIVIVEKEKLVGLFTERDALRLLASKTNIEKLKIKDVMNKPKFVINENESIADAANLLKEKNIRRLPVIDDEGRAVGMVTANLISKNMKYLMARNMTSGVTNYINNYI